MQYSIKISSIPKKTWEALDRFLTQFEILDSGYEATLEFGKIRPGIENRAVPTVLFDRLIAAYTKSPNLILVTNDVREFQRFLGLKLDKIDASNYRDWPFHIFYKIDLSDEINATGPVYFNLLCPVCLCD